MIASVHFDVNRANCAKFLRCGWGCCVGPAPNISVSHMSQKIDSKATVSAGFVSGMLAGLHRRGLDTRPLLIAAEIDIAESASADDYNRIPASRYAWLYNRIVSDYDDEGFGLFSRRLPVGFFEFLCRGMLGAPTLAVALDRAARFLRVVLPDLAVCIRREGRCAELRIAETLTLAADPDDPGRVFAFEWLLRLLHGLASWFVGRGLALDSVSFPYARPAHADDYELVYTRHSCFDADVLCARFDVSLLDLPVRRDEGALAAFLDGAPGKITMLYRRDREMVIRVRDLLRDHLPDNLSLQVVAARLLLSPRTLNRRLEDEGSGFRAIKDALRRDIAVARLTRTRMPIAAIASELGYADPSAFYRAFVSWVGASPEAFRRHHDGKS